MLELRKTTESHRDGSRFSNRYSQPSSYVLFYVHTLYKELLEIRTKVISDGTNSDSLVACHELSSQYVGSSPTVLTRSDARFSRQMTMFVPRAFSEGCTVGPVVDKMALTRIFLSKWVFPAQL